MNRPAQFTALVAVTALLAGCAPGLAANPRYATDGSSGGGDQTSTAAPPEGPPPIAVPKNDLAWQECTSEVFGDAALPTPPSIRLDCATFDADLDPIDGATGSLTIGVVRARSVQTPEDAGPVVLTTGSDLPTSQQLPVWLSRSGADVLAKHPIVAVDRRGMGMSSAVDCRDLTFGDWATVKAAVDRSLALARTCRGVILATGNHLPANIPAPMLEQYRAYVQANRNR